MCIYGIDNLTIEPKRRIIWHLPWKQLEAATRKGPRPGEAEESLAELRRSRSLGDFLVDFFDCREWVQEWIDEMVGYWRAPRTRGCKWQGLETKLGLVRFRA